MWWYMDRAMSLTGRNKSVESEMFWERQDAARVKTLRAYVS